MDFRLGFHPGLALGDARRSYSKRMTYQTLRSISDHHVFVICRDGSFTRGHQQTGTPQISQRGLSEFEDISSFS